MPQLYAGTSGFAYDQWKPDFYPAKMPSKQFLSHYASRLNTTEVNYTFRRLPSASTLTGWVQATPAHFVFALKAHMRLTHILRLKNAGEFLDVFFKAIEPLRSSRRLGPILYQLPPAMKADNALLADFVALLPSDVRHTFEFRHASWLTDEIYDMLRGRGISLCLAESDKLVIPPVITADFVYARLRKPSYSDEDLADIRARVDQNLASGHDTYLYFKHEESPEGALNAEKLIRAMGAAA